jgi:biofilm PGA synthesis N-glycosyltransferase PgaC
MHFWQYLLATSFFIVFYNYAGYALIAYTLTALRRRHPEKTQAEMTPFTPSISFIVAAYNEEECIGEKIVNCLEQDYPAEKIEFIFVTDGSSDRTPEIVSRYPAVRLLHEDQRKGKSAAMNRAVGAARHNILIFSDANTVLNKAAISNIARHYREKQTGGVAGEKKVIPPGRPLNTPGGESHNGSGDKVHNISGGQDHNGPGGGEGAYWKYESRLKKIDSAFYSVVGAAGELFSVRKELYVPLEDSIVLDDFVLSLRVAEKGYRIRYEPEACATELPSFSIEDEQKRKIRIAAGGFQAMKMLGSLLKFWRQPALSFLYISHRVLRWTLSPLCFILALIANGVLVLQPDHGRLVEVLLAGQLLFYSLALAGGVLMQQNKRQPKAVKLAYYFVFMNISVIRGFFRYLKGGQKATWEKARRAQAV